MCLMSAVSRPLRIRERKMAGLVVKVGVRGGVGGVNGDLEAIVSDRN